jgi:thiol-disulfide isomerase/thioredoxin
MKPVVLLALLVLLLTGCTDAPSVTAPDLSTRVDVDTAELRAAKAKLGVDECPDVEGSAQAAGGLPDVALPCLGGGREVNLSGIEGPAVVSLWASWCVSCPDELPLYQRLSDEGGDRLTVLGIDYQDVQPGGAMALLETTKATFPQLADPGGELAEHYRLNGLPAVLLVDAQGEVTFKKMLIESYAQLVGLVEDHTGVTVRAG